MIKLDNKLNSLVRESSQEELNRQLFTALMRVNWNGQVSIVSSLLSSPYYTTTTLNTKKRKPVGTIKDNQPEESATPPPPLKKCTPSHR